MSDQGTAATGAVPSPYPASTKTLNALISSVPTTLTRILFADKIFLTISQSGRLNHWLHVPLSAPSPTDTAPLAISDFSYDDEDDERGEEEVDSTLLPYTHLTATTILGGTKPDFEVLGQTLATTVASAILVKRPEERRMLVVGLGLENAEVGHEGFEGLVGLCLEAL